MPSYSPGILLITFSDYKPQVNNKNVWYKLVSPFIGVQKKLFIKALMRLIFFILKNTKKTPKLTIDIYTPFSKIYKICINMHINAIINVNY